MKVVVTGGAGFIGAHLCREMLDYCHAENVDMDVLVVDDLSTGSTGNLDGLDVELCEGSILDEDLMASVTQRASAIVHLAARGSVPRSLDDPLATYDVNVGGTVRVLEAARRSGGCHVVMASSSSVYGANEVLPKSEDLAPRPMSPYAASKSGAESFALAYQHSFGLPVLVFRFFNVFGPLQPAGHAYAAAVPNFVLAALIGQRLQIFGDGRQTRDFTYVGTVAHALREAVTSKVTCRDPVNLAFGAGRSLLDVVASLESLLRRSLDVEHLPPRKGDVKHLSADASAFRALFPTVVERNFAEALTETVAWFQEEVLDGSAGGTPRHTSGDGE